MRNVFNGEHTCGITTKLKEVRSNRRYVHPVDFSTGQVIDMKTTMKSFYSSDIGHVARKNDIPDEIHSIITTLAGH